MRRIINILFGCILTVIGLFLLKHTHLVTGGTAGLSLSLAYLSQIPFAYLFFCVNIPFYILSVIRMGWTFTLYSILSVTMLSVLSGLDHWLPAFTLPGLVGALAGGIVVGFGLIVLFLNGSSLGGANILALYLQKRLQWDPGKVMFAFDLLVVIIGLSSVGLERGIYSIISIAVTSAMISYFKNRIGSQTKLSAAGKPAAYAVKRNVQTT